MKAIPIALAFLVVLASPVRAEEPREAIPSPLATREAPVPEPALPEPDINYYPCEMFCGTSRCVRWCSTQQRCQAWCTPQGTAACYCTL